MSSRVLNSVYNNVGIFLFEHTSVFENYFPSDKLLGVLCCLDLNLIIKYIWLNFVLWQAFNWSDRLIIKNGLHEIPRTTPKMIFLGGGGGSTANQWFIFSSIVQEFLRRKNKSCLFSCEVFIFLVSCSIFLAYHSSYRTDVAAGWWWWHGQIFSRSFKRNFLETKTKILTYIKGQNCGQEHVLKATYKTLNGY